VGEQRRAASQKSSGRLHGSNNSNLGHRLFLTSSKPSSFNPLEASSATLLKQADEELSAVELTLKESLKNYQKEKDNETSLPHLLEDLQQAYMDLGYWEEALGVERTKCADFFQPNTDEYADSIHAQGKFSLRQEDFKNSKRLYEQALDYFTNTQNDVQRGHVLISLAGWYFFRDQLTEAMQHLQDSEALLDSNPSLLVKCLDNQGLIHRLWGEYDTALDKYRQALQVVADDDTRQALNFHVADMLVALEEPDQALDVYQELLLETKASNAGMQGVLLHNIATIHVDQGDYELALEEFHQALQIKQETGGEHNPEVATTWNSLGALHATVFDEKVQALECFKKVLLIARVNAEDPKTDTDVLNAIQNISLIEQQLNNEE
jgi:tetratricopeptide (TPR) repeat protein